MKSRKTRERILDASLELFNQKKASNVSTVQISAAMKISPGNLYYYYANKEDVVRCIWDERMSDEFNVVLEKTIDIKSASDLLDFLKECLAHLVKYRFFYTEISTLFLNDEELVKMYASVLKDIRDKLTNMVLRLGEEGKFIDTDDVTRVLAIQNAIAAALHIIGRYDICKESGMSDEKYIGYSWIRLVSTLEPIFMPEMKAEMDAELETRGFDKKRYIEIV